MKILSVLIISLALFGCSEDAKKVNIEETKENTADSAEFRMKNIERPKLREEVPQNPLLKRQKEKTAEKK